MRFEFLPGEPLSDAFRRIVLEQIEVTITLLQDHEEDRVVRIHEARKHLKQIRALLRLFREPLGATFQSENGSLRHSARALSAIRDRDVVEATLRKLIEEAGLRPEALNESIAIIGKARLDADSSLPDDFSSALTTVPLELASFAGRVGSWRFSGEGFELIAPGVERMYRKGRRSLGRAVNSRSSEDLHRWRKRVKDLWYMLRLLGGASTGVLECHRNLLKELSDLLGRHHDLQLVRGVLSEFPENPIAAEVVALVEAGQSSLSRSSIAVGRQLYAEKPGPFLRRVRSHWMLWREDESREGQLDAPG